MSFNVDYDERTEFPILEPGVYAARIHSAESSIGPQANYLKLRFSLTNNELNTQAWFNLSLANGASWRVKNLVRELGLADGKITYKSRAEYEAKLAEMLIGQEVSITIATREFEGALFDEVTKIKRPTANTLEA